MVILNVSHRTNFDVINMNHGKLFYNSWILCGIEKKAMERSKIFSNQIIIDVYWFGVITKI